MITMSNFGNNGRLGNQLFQYASMIGISKKYNIELVLPEWEYNKYFNTSYIYENLQTSKTIIENKFHYCDNFVSLKEAISGNIDVNFNGYFQSEKYWKHCKNHIKDQFEFKSSFIYHCKYKLKHIFDNGKENICIHVRRGDYVNNSNYAELSIMYYYTSLEMISDWRNKNILIFSDDIEYCKIHFQCLDNVYFPNGDELEDLCTMTLCDYHIIANSSYSWWGAYLSQSKKVIHPDCLFAGRLLEQNLNDGKDFYLREWSPNTIWKNWKFDARDVTFMIPYKYDNEDRKENLELCEKYIRQYFNTNIDVYQASESVFHRTKYLNTMAKLCNESIVINQDCDVLIPPIQLIESIIKVRNGIDVCYPYDGRFAGLNRYLWYYKLLNNLDLGICNNYELKGNDKFNTYGGCIIFNREAFIKGGMENENFISWGAEDYERYERFTKLEFKVKRIKGLLFHVNHFIGVDSSKKNPYFDENEKEYQKVKNMTKEELLNYIKTWKWIN